MKLEDAQSPYLTFEEQTSDVDAPPPGHWVIEFKADGLFLIDPAGVVRGPFATTSALAADVAALAATHAADKAASEAALAAAVADLEADISAGVDIELVTAGVIASGEVHTVGGTDVPVTDGGTGASDAATARTNLGAAAAGTIVIPETHTYSINGSVNTLSVFPPFFVNEDYGALVLVAATVKLRTGTATFKVRRNEADQVTGLNITSSATNHNFGPIALSDLDGIDIQLTAASSAADLSVTLHFERSITLPS